MPTKSVKDVRWYFTGKMMFHYESARIFYREAGTIVLVSLGLVLTLLVVCYRSLPAGLVLLIPIRAGVGPNCGLIHLIYDEVNPIVLAASGVLFGLRTDYGVHLWGRFVGEFDQGTPVSDALSTVYRATGPAVFLAR
ncbi:MAG: MMPL family transporter [Deltaproteobacteria bacterium]|nr:MMPL family transporter [Deltaproteobacteria bacterium]